MKAVIWHNPRCSKSRAALAMLEEAGAEIEMVEYLKTSPSRDALAALLSRGGFNPRVVLRTSEPGARALVDADDVTLLDAMAADPILIERPIVETAKGVRLGRPPERVREIL